MKKFLAFLFAAALLASVGVVFANEDGEDEDSSEVRSESNQVESDREERKKELEEKREALKQERERKREEIKNQREEEKQSFEEARESWKKDREEELEKFKEEKEKLREEFKEKFTAERCSKIQERIREREGNFDGAEGKHSKVYANLIERLNKFVARFDEKGLDTSAIKGHLAELQSKIDKFKADYAAYISKLKESKNFTCGHSEGDFKATMVDAKALLKTVHADAAEIRTFVRETIFVDIKALKDQLPKEVDEDDDENEAENEND